MAYQLAGTDSEQAAVAKHERISFIQDIKSDDNGGTVTAWRGHESSVGL